MNDSIEALRQAAAAEVVKDGKITFALNHGNVVLVHRDAQGQPYGITVDLAREIAADLGAEPRFFEVDRAADVSGNATTGAWDICFLAVDPKRAETISFTKPYIAIEGSFLVLETSPVAEPEDVDALKLSVGVSRGSAYALHLLRESKGARIIEYESIGEVVDAFTSGAVNAMAGVRQAVEAIAADIEGARLIERPFMTIRQAIGTRRDLPHTAAFLKAFVDEGVASGRIGRILGAHGVEG